MAYRIRARDNSWTLRKETIRRYVPGVLEYPVKRSRQFGLQPWATIDIGGVITGNIFVINGIIPPEQYKQCLKELMDNIEETDTDRFSSQSPLLTVLENAWERHRGDVFRILPYFFCLANLIQGQSLRGSPALQAELSDFFLKHAGTICRSSPLKYSLQFVDMCPDSTFQDCMERLIVKLPPEQRHELEERRGKVRLFLDGEPSEKIKRYMRRRISRRTPAHPMMAPHHHPRNGHPFNQRGRRRVFDRETQWVPWNGPFLRRD